MLVVATHLDDETLGCGGSLLRYKAEGADIHWLLVTEPTIDLGYDTERLKEREKKVYQVSEMYGFESIHRLRFPAAQLDRASQSELIKAIAAIFREVCPSIIYLPFCHDVHSDHRIVFDASYSAAKTFRAPYLKRILMMETLSETEFSVSIQSQAFSPNVFVDVTDYFDKKLDIMNVFSDELGAHPFPRSLEHLKALAIHRGATAGCRLAEAFVLLKETI